MILKVLAVRDIAADVFGQPFFSTTIGAANRNFGDQINRKDDVNNPLGQHPEDFELYHLGDYDDSTASFALFEKPKQISVGKNLVR